MDVFITLICLLAIIYGSGFFQVIGLVILFIVVVLKLTHHENNTENSKDSEKTKKESIKAVEKYAMEKGKVGEIFVSKFMQSKKFEVLQNIYLSTKNGTTELDIFAIDKCGICIVEVKNYKAVIKGDGLEDMWEAKYKNGKVYPMYNPIKQNQTHIDLVQRVLKNEGFLASTFHSTQSIIVFSNETELHLANIPRGVIVCNMRDLDKALIKYRNTENINFTERTISDILMLFSKYTNVSEELKQEHIKQVSKRRG